MSHLNDFINKTKDNEGLMKVWADMEPEVQKHIKQLVASGITNVEAERMAVQVVEVLIEEEMDKQLVQMVDERKYEEARTSLGEVVEKFNIGAEEVLKLVNKVEID